MSKKKLDFEEDHEMLGPCLNIDTSLSEPFFSWNFVDIMFYNQECSCFALSQWFPTWVTWEISWGTPDISVICDIQFHEKLFIGSTISFIFLSGGTWAKKVGNRCPEYRTCCLAKWFSTRAPLESTRVPLKYIYTVTNMACKSASK